MTNRQKIINDIMSMPSEVLMTEPDCTSLCQAFWTEYLAYWDLLSQGEFTLATEALMNGSWTDQHLNDHLIELLKIKVFAYRK